jgi:hypothetical protein
LKNQFMIGIERSGHRGVINTNSKRYYTLKINLQV